MRTLRILILLLFVPTALMPVRLDFCLDCLLGEMSCCERAEEACCCCGGEETEAPASPSCCSSRADDGSEDLVEIERSRPAPRDCCLHIDNDRDELPASSQAFELPPLLCRLGLTAIQPEPPRLNAPRPTIAPEAEPPPSSPLPLLI